jgi:nitric oxide reductase NorQ protein
MSIALLVQSPNTTAGINQTVIVPNYTTGVVDIYHRIATGQRGRAESWQLTPINKLSDELINIDRDPVAVRLSGLDSEAIATGKITTLAVKLQNTATYNHIDVCSDYESHLDMVHDLVARLANCDSTLGEYLHDSRYSSDSIVIEPLVAPVTIPEIKSEIVADTLTGNITTSPVSTPALVTSGARLELASIPDIKWSQEYINRQLVGNTSEFDVYDTAMRNHENILIKGHAGSGKTLSVMAYASARGYRYYNVSCHVGVEPSQLFGKWNPNENGHFHWQDGAVTDLVRNGGVLLLNEVNFMPERVSTVLFSLLDYRREIQLMDKDGEVVKAHPDLLIVADMNPAYRGTRELNQAWNDRFDHKLEFPYEPSIERKLIKNTAVIDMANQLRDRFEQDEIQTPISTRALVAFMRSIDNLGLDYAMYSYINSFPTREKQAVELICQTYRANIEAGQGITGKSISDTADKVGA